MVGMVAAFMIIVKSKLIASLHWVILTCSFTKFGTKESEIECSIEFIVV